MNLWKPLQEKFRVTADGVQGLEFPNKKRPTSAGAVAPRPFRKASCSQTLPGLTLNISPVWWKYPGISSPMLGKQEGRWVNLRVRCDEDIIKQKLSEGYSGECAPCGEGGPRGGQGGDFESCYLWVSDGCGLPDWLSWGRLDFPTFTVICISP